MDKEEKALFESKTITESIRLLKTDPQKGLTEKEALERLAKGGRNELKEKKPKSPAESFLE